MDGEMLLDATEAPSGEQIDYILTEYARCGPREFAWNSMTVNDDVRFCVWANQSPDGRKRDSKEGNFKAMPWEGASDTRPFVVDDMINELAALVSSAYARAVARGSSADDEASGYAVAMIDHLTGEKLATDLGKEVELSAQYFFHYGWAVLTPYWRTKVALRRERVTIVQLAALAQQLAPKRPDLPGLGDIQIMLDPSLGDAAFDYVDAIYDAYVRGQYAGRDLDFPPLRRATVRKLLKGLRTEGYAEVPIPYLCEDGPRIEALKPWDEFFFPPGATELQESPILFQREFVTLAELDSRAKLGGYDATWTEAAKTHVGTDTSSPTPTAAQSIAVSTIGTVQSGPTSAVPNGYVELVHAFYMANDADGVTGVYCTTVHPQVKGKGRAAYAKHELIDYAHGKYPFVLGRREFLSRSATASRGVAAIASTWQAEEKGLRDATLDWASISIIPPVNVPKDSRFPDYKFGPAIRNTVTLGREPKFMDIPGNNVPGTLEALDRLELRRNRYFGLAHPEIVPGVTQLRAGSTVQKFLMMWIEAFEQTLSLVQQYMDDGEFSRITGAPAGWLEQRRPKIGLLSTKLAFDVRELDEEMMLKRIEAMNKAVLPSDTEGVIRKRAWIEIMVRAINPAWVRELVQPQAEATQALFNSVENDIAMMFLGNPPKMVEDDPTAGAKLQFASRILQANPNYQQALAQPGRFQKLMEDYVKNLSFSVQQRQNAQIGRIGVNPEAGQ